MQCWNTATGEAHHDKVAAIGQAAQAFIKGWAADGIHQAIHAAPARGRAHRITEGRGAIQHQIRAAGAQHVVLRDTGARNHLGATGLGNFNSSKTNTTRRAMHQHPIARFDLAAPQQGRAGGGVGNRETDSRFQGQAIGDGDGVDIIGNGFFCHAAPIHHGKNPRARRRRIRIGRGLKHRTDDLSPWRKGQRWLPLVFARHHQLRGEGNACRRDLNPHTARA